MRELTELMMSNSFNFAIKDSKVKGIPTFDLVYKEVVCQQGIADFIGVTSSAFLKNNNFGELSSIESDSKVLSLLKPKAGRSKKYILKQTGLAEATLNRVLKELVLKNYAVQNNNLYYLSNPSAFEKMTIWAFELKLSNWKRAIFQALQYKAFANYSIVVFPFEKEKVLMEHIDSFTELNIGLLLFDTETCKTKWLTRPKKERPVSKWHTLFMLEKIAAHFSQDNYILENYAK